MKFLGIAAVALAALATTSAYASDTTNRSYSDPNWWVSQMDTNYDGSISRGEFDSAQMLRFNRLDVNRNGTVTVMERQVAVDRWNANYPNAKVQLTAAERADLRYSDYGSYSGTLFDQLDSNRNGLLSQVELNAAHHNGRLDSAIEGYTDFGAPDRSYSGPTFWLGQMDSNQDGIISRNEFNAGRTTQFSSLDANHDGSIAFSERETALISWNKNHPNNMMYMTDEGPPHPMSADPGVHSHVMFNKFDSNKDGMISQVEFDNAHNSGQPFRATDASYSGPTWWLSQMDTDKNGSISRAEFNVGRTIRFTSLDANRNGTVTVAERNAAIDRWNVAHPNDRLEPTGGEFSDRTSNDYNTHSGVLFDKLDTGRNGEISKVELDSAQSNGQLDRTMEGNTDRDASQPPARRTTGTGGADRSGDGTGNAPQMQ